MICLLPDAVLSLAEEQRRKIACVLVMVAAADGALVREEISAIESSMGLMMLHPESREEVRQLLTQPPELDSILDGMEIPAIRIALRDSALLASVDGDYDESELWALKRIADAGGLTEEDLSKILDWVSDSWKLSANGRSIIAFPMPGDDAML
ncbi:MAG: hypothetical protein GWP21_01310 [Euryarchaeota archaeon]|nr:TerB family tellurite resistance protein [Euryarchaeota archaeon]MBT7245378.1 TerB family tellurite resistance protein [Euryarchaeota archaeon]NCF96533.1 hypothetical protein [Euryarchaeota archaeon]